MKAAKKMEKLRRSRSDKRNSNSSEWGWYGCIYVRMLTCTRINYSRFINLETILAKHSASAYVRVRARVYKSITLGGGTSECLAFCNVVLQRIRLGFLPSCCCSRYCIRKQLSVLNLCTHTYTYLPTESTSELNCSLYYR